MYINRKYLCIMIVLRWSRFHIGSVCCWKSVKCSYFSKACEECNLAGIKMLAVTGAGAGGFAIMSCTFDDGTQWWLLLVSEQPSNGWLFNVLWFNFLLFLAVRGGLVNLSYFFIMFVHSSPPVNETPQKHGRGDRIYCTSPSTCGALKRELLNGQSTIKQPKLTHPSTLREGISARHYYNNTVYLFLIIHLSSKEEDAIHSNVPLLPPASPIMAVWRWPSPVPEGLGACLFFRPQLLLHPVMNAPVLGHWAEASSPKSPGKAEDSDKCCYWR